MLDVTPKWTAFIQRKRQELLGFGVLLKDTHGQEKADPPTLLLVDHPDIMKVYSWDFKL